MRTRPLVSIAMVALFTTALDNAVRSAPTVGGATLPSTLPTTVFHRVRSGETFSSLAASYYGDVLAASFIVAANHLTQQRPLRDGETLRIPTAVKLRVPFEISLGELARRYLGDRRRASYLAAINGLRPESSVSAGRELTMPCQLVHRAANREALAEIAVTFYGDARKAELLRAYNFLGGALFLQKGQSVIMPASHLRARTQAAKSDLPSEAKRESSGSASSGGKPTTTRASEPDPVTAGLAMGDALFDQGKYDEIPAMCLALALSRPTPLQSMELHRLMAFAMVGLGHPRVAAFHFREILRQAPSFQLDPKQVSPKIQQALDEARQPQAARGTAL